MDKGDQFELDERGQTGLNFPPLPDSKENRAKVVYIVETCSKIYEFLMIVDII